MSKMRQRDSMGTGIQYLRNPDTAEGTPGTGAAKELEAHKERERLQRKAEQERRKKGKRE